jgi:peptidoglycan/xylan/chitin deacetylase (PgdA/CDA1 family)
VAGQDRSALAGAAQAALTVPEADRMLAWLGRAAGFLSPAAFLDSDAPGVLLTVDDGKANHAAYLLPLLERHEAPAVFFVATQHVRDPDAWLADEQRAAAAHWGSRQAVPAAAAQRLYQGMPAETVARCARHPLVTVGAHSESHPRLPDCADDALAAELAGPKAYLEEVTGGPVGLIAYPYGAYDRRVLDATRQAGYEYGFALGTRLLGPRSPGMLRYQIPRLHVEIADPFYLATKLSGLDRRPLRGRPWAAGPAAR